MTVGNHTWFETEPDLAGNERRRRFIQGESVRGEVCADFQPRLTR